MNVSAIGLVDILVEGWYLVAELLGLGLSYMIMALALEGMARLRNMRSV